MKPIYSTEEFDNAKSLDKLPCQCYTCDKVFLKEKKEIVRQQKNNKDYIKYCSIECLNNRLSNKLLVECVNCGLNFYKKKCEVKKNKNNFCGSSCSATFNNKKKEFGIRRSKLELFIENNLTSIYPNIHMLFNDKTTIGSELDIFIPSLNIAFELNGIFHYEPIYGVDKYERIVENDKSKSKLCHEHMIDLCIINTSGQKVFTEKSSKKYLGIITEVIDSRISMVEVRGIEPRSCPS